jgi:hypothetical protein
MAERIVQEESLTMVADAIRAKGGTSEALSFPTGFADAIAAIQAGGGGADVLTGEVTIQTNNSSFGLEIPKPQGYENGTVPKFAAFCNVTDFASSASTQATVKCLFAFADGVNGYRKTSTSTFGTNLNKGKASDICKWYGVKLWFYASHDANYKTLRAGDVYKYIIVL